ncbi:hypothetical protein AB1N83_007713 [Pleurotus pulmonarius]
MKTHSSHTLTAQRAPLPHLLVIFLNLQASSFLQDVLFNVASRSFSTFIQRLQHTSLHLPLLSIIVYTFHILSVFRAMGQTSGAPWPLRTTNQDILALPRIALE